MSQLKALANIFTGARAAKRRARRFHRTLFCVPRGARLVSLASFPPHPALSPRNGGEGSLARSLWAGNGAGAPLESMQALSARHAFGLDPKDGIQRMAANASV